jgi:hypothetical protein
MYLDTQELRSEDAGASLADAIRASLRRTIGMIAGIAPREEVDVAAPADEPAQLSSRSDLDRHRQDPLIVRAEEYTRLAWRVSGALAPVVAARGEPTVIDAVATIQWFSLRVSSKIFRAVVGRIEHWEPDEQVQTDCNGSAKTALLWMAESRHAWDVLMEAGKATANGVPAQAVAMLDALDAAVRTRFPHAMAFVRPGFDEAAIGAPGQER